MLVPCLADIPKGGLGEEEWGCGHWARQNGRPCLIHPATCYAGQTFINATKHTARISVALLCLLSRPKVLL